MATPSNARGLRDATFSKSVALPNAANTTNTNVIDLGVTSPYPMTERIALKISTSAATGANSKNINIRIVDSADNSSFANVATLGNPMLRVTDNANAGFAATSATFSLPPGLRRYIRGSAVGEANGGDASDGTYKIELLF